jgi:N-acetylglucosamine-6-phosphate deacetylase
VKKIVLRNVNSITPFRIIENSGIIIEGKKIAEIGKLEDLSFDPDEEYEFFDFDGMYAVPGFIDLHVHGGLGYGFEDEDEDALFKISEFFFQHGTTGLLATLYPKPEKEFIRELRRLADFIEQNHSNIWGIHLEGPFLNPEERGAMNPDYLLKPSLDAWYTLRDAGRGFIKIMTIAPELPGAYEVMREAALDGVILSIGHSIADIDEIQTAIHNGAAHVTHMFNAMKPFHHRDPGVITGSLLFDELKIELIADGIHVHPMVMKLLYKIKGASGIILITDAMKMCGLPDGEYEFADQKVIVKDKKIFLEDGTLAGSMLTMERAVKVMVELVDVPITSAVRMASLNPARVLGKEHRKGILATGKDADIVVLDKDFNVHMTIYEGEIKYKRD